MKKVHRISTKQHAGIKSSVAHPKIQPSHKQVELVHSFAGRRTSRAIPRSV